MANMDLEQKTGPRFLSLIQANAQSSQVLHERVDDRSQVEDRQFLSPVDWFLGSLDGIVCSDAEKKGALIDTQDLILPLLHQIKF